MKYQQTLNYALSVMNVITETQLLNDIEEFRDRHSMARTTFGREATGNANLVKELEEGKSPSLKTVNRIADYMRRKDADAATRAKLEAPLAGLPAEEEREIPFSSAPVTRTGASSPTSSPMNGRQQPRAASDSCPSCSNPDGAQSPDEPGA